MPDENKKTYFASDLHLGLYPPDKSLEREKLFVRWLNAIRHNAHAIFLVGDIFDFWWEYKKVVPRGFTRFLGKISELTDSGIPVHFFTGNHDIWIKDYLPDETGIILHRKPYVTTINGKTFFIAHGDDLGPGDTGYKILNKLFKNRFLQWLYSRLHPNLSISIGQAWAKKSRYSKDLIENFKGENSERQILFAKNMLKTNHFDYFVFGHRHIPLQFKLNNHSTLIYLGDWIIHYSYGVFDKHGFRIEQW